MATLDADDLVAIAALLPTAAQRQADLYTALELYDVSHSSSHLAGTTLSVSGLVGAAAVVGPRQPQIVDDLFTSVRLSLRDKNKNNYPDDLMCGYYNRAIQECWHLMIQIGAEIAMNTGTIVADGVAADYVLPADFRAFVPGRLLPRSPATATSNYGYGTPMQQVGLLDKMITGAPTLSATPTAFSVFWSGNSQYVRFGSIPPAGERYDFQYYPEPAKIGIQNIASTYTPWLGLLDMLLERILEEFCREGLEFLTQKRSMWRAKTEADIVMLLGLRHLTETTNDPSMWKGFPA